MKQMFTLAVLVHVCGVSAQILLQVFIFAILLSSCSNPESVIKGAIRQKIEDVAFKQNLKIKTFEIKSLTWSEVGENTLDTFRLIEIQGKANIAEQSAKNYLEMAKLHRQQISLYHSLESSELADVAKTDWESDIAKAKEQNEILNKLSKEDSILRDGIKKRVSEPLIYYKAKFLLKATIGETNVLDTLVYVIKKEDKTVIWPVF